MSRYKLYSERLQTWSPLALQLEVVEDLKKKVSTVNGIEPDENGNVAVFAPEESDIRLTNVESNGMYPSGTSEITIDIPNFNGVTDASLIFVNNEKLSEDKYNIVESNGEFKVVFNPPLSTDSNVNIVSTKGQGFSVGAEANQWQEF